MRSGFFYFTIFQNKNVVGMLNRRQAVAAINVVRSFWMTSRASWITFSDFMPVDVCRRFVQNQYRRVVRQCPCKRNQLPFPRENVVPPSVTGSSYRFGIFPMNDPHDHFNAAIARFREMFGLFIVTLEIWCR